MRLAYDENVASGSSEKKCSTCTEWADNIRHAFATTASHRERCQLLTLLPSTLTRNEVQKIITEASFYIINRSRKLREAHGVWYVPDPYTRCKGLGQHSRPFAAHSSAEQEDTEQSLKIPSLLGHRASTREMRSPKSATTAKNNTQPFMVMQSGRQTGKTDKGKRQQTPFFLWT
ncbi:hypothetical protein HPB47_007419 [Ixodes persulcatus]|uniref:Uncharacterized protein n=1 Tax=Ixodes persulcatus TaxID=34615 RepID=A0AC60P7Z8_IXOPE|nr:hypothetical protein HPB47_007419 [Ixodes persulcatus]